jgi:hypothetical protein
MATGRRQRFVHGQTAWMAGTVLVGAVTGVLSYEFFFVSSFLGFLVLLELTAPFNVTPRWRARLRVFVVLGLVVFGYIVVRRIQQVLGGVL